MHILKTVSLLSIDESTIRSHATAQSFERGSAYYRNGVVVSLTQRGDVLIGAVEGSEYEPYRVTLEVDAGGVAAANCSCPYAFGGWCKHIVATLLASLHHPEQIEQHPTLEALLDPLNRDQLRTLLASLVVEYPDLVDLIELHVNVARQPVSAQPASSQSVKPSRRRTRIDPQPFRRQAQGILYRAEGYWDDAPAIEEIRGLVAKAVEFTIQGDGDNALEILAAIIDAYVASWMNLDGSSGESGDFFDELDEAVAEAILSATLTPNEQAVWRSKLEAWRAEVEEYGIDYGFADSDKALAHGWDDPQLTAVLQGEAGSFSESTVDDLYGRRSLTQIRLDILERQERYEEYLNLARATGQTQAYLTMLACLGQVEAVMAQAPEQLNSPTAALAVAQALRSQGELDNALEIAEMGLSLSGPGIAQLALWTSELAEGMGEREKGLQGRITAFEHAPSLSDYLKIQELAGPSHWPEDRERLLTSLRNSENVFSSEAQVDIFLHEGLLEDAIKAVDRLSSFQSVLVQRVMDAVSEQHPDWVIDNACRRAESIMNEGKAKYYANAVEWLRKAKAAYQQAGRHPEWQAYYGGLVQKHSRKRKLIGLLKGL